jgi:hypothetical protein
LKLKPTPFEVGLKETYRWYTRNHKPRTAGFEFDDKLLAMVKNVAGGYHRSGARRHYG